MVDPGDEVIVFSPAFITYENLVHMCGGKLVKVPLKKENNYQIHMEDLKAAVTDKTKLLVMNNPNNPTGAVLQQRVPGAGVRAGKKRRISLFFLMKCIPDWCMVTENSIPLLPSRI